MPIFIFSFRGQLRSCDCNILISSVIENVVVFLPPISYRGEGEDFRCQSSDPILNS